jgi:hypothetical protein
MLAGHDGSTCGRAYRGGSVGIGKSDRPCRQFIQVGSVIEFTAIATKIFPSQVIYQDKDDIGMIPWLAGNREESHQEQQADGQVFNLNPGKVIVFHNEMNN